MNSDVSFPCRMSQRLDTHVEEYIIYYFKKDRKMGVLEDFN